MEEDWENPFMPVRKVGKDPDFFAFLNAEMALKVLVLSVTGNFLMPTVVVLEHILNAVRMTNKTFFCASQNVNQVTKGLDQFAGRYVLIVITNVGHSVLPIRIIVHWK